MLLGGHVKNLDDIEFLQAENFDFGELVISRVESMNYWTGDATKAQLNNGFVVVAHAPREGPPNDPVWLQQQYYPALLACIDFLSRVGIPALTIHMWMDHRFIRQIAVKEKISALNRLVEYAKDRNVSINLENLSESATDLVRILSEVPDLGITLDVGHAQLLTDNNNSVEIVRECSAHIKHVHVHDNRGGDSVKDDLHLPPGQGIIDFNRIFMELDRFGYDGTMTIEVEKEDLLKSRDAVNRILTEVQAMT